jgi:hypothetical protein
VHTTSTTSADEEICVSPTMTGAPHLSGDEAAFATAWFDLVGAVDEEKAISTTITEKALSPATTTMTPSSSDEIPGHCAFSAEEVDELLPGHLYTGIRRGEGSLNWKRQVEQLLRQFLAAALFVEFLDEPAQRQRQNTEYLGTDAAGGGGGHAREGLAAMQ